MAFVGVALFGSSFPLFASSVDEKSESQYAQIYYTYWYHEWQYEVWQPFTWYLYCPLYCRDLIVPTILHVWFTVKH